MTVIGIALGMALMNSPAEIHISALYQTSPLEVRQLLRKEFTNGLPTRAKVEHLVETTGDHSFDSFRVLTESMKQVFKLQNRGLDSWMKRDYENALGLYLKAQAICVASGVKVESQFCLYYLAEIRAEQGLHQECLSYLDQAIQDFCSDRHPFLAALLYESRGYALWFLDYLPEAVESFALATRYWKRIGFDSGIVASWNNLACLYEQLYLPRKADQCYRASLHSLTPGVLPEVSFQLLRNYAVFQKRQGKDRLALKYLGQCSQFRSVSPDEFQLAEAEILENENSLKSIHSALLVVKIEKEFLLGEIYLQRENSNLARRHLKKAIKLSKRHGIPFYKRRGTLMMGKCLEQEGRWAEAAAIYAESCRAGKSLLRVGTLLPYIRITSPLFDGWIRCLVRLGKQTEARQAIHRRVRLRQQKAVQLLNRFPDYEYYSDTLEQLAGVISTGSEDLSSFDLTQQAPLAQPKDCNLIELWPNDDQVLVWLETETRTQFRILPLNQRVRELIEELVSSYHSDRFSLPNSPPANSLDLLDQALFHPVESLISSRRIAIIPHGELQSIPFEVLTEAKGYSVSYLPSIDQYPGKAERVSGYPVLVMPEPFSQRAGAKTEYSKLKKWFPNLRVVNGFCSDAPLEAKWIHASTHFRLNCPVWPFSTFEGSGSGVPVVDILKAGIRCQLLSIGACNVANNHFSNSPYWLGLSELLFLGGAQSLVLSRWQLDEAASQIFVDFFHFCREGLSMDEAIHLARLKFQKTRIKRRQALTSGSHPFFWAGIIYVGKPGRHLYPQSIGEDLQFFLLTLFLIAAALLSQLCSRKRM